MSAMPRPHGAAAGAAGAGAGARSGSGVAASSAGTSKRSSAVLARYATTTPMIISGVEPGPDWADSRTPSTIAESGSRSTAATAALIPTPTAGVRAKPGRCDASTPAGGPREKGGGGGPPPHPRGGRRHPPPPDPQQGGGAEQEPPPAP